MVDDAPVDDANAYRVDGRLGGSGFRPRDEGMVLREALARPESDTLYFTGEAADVHGHGSTVHGAYRDGPPDGKIGGTIAGRVRRLRASICPWRRISMPGRESAANSGR